MPAITAAEIQLTGLPAIEKLLKLVIDEHVNHHVRCHYVGVMSNNADIDLIYGQMAKTTVQIRFQSAIIFQGLPQSIRIYSKNRLCILDMECCSTTKNMDTEQHCQSFQNRNMLYSDIIAEVFSKPNGYSAIIACMNDRKIQRPIIQYKETDWAFTLRMAGHLETVVIPNTRSGSPQLMFGIPRGNSFFANPAQYNAARFEKINNDGKRREFRRYTFRDERHFELGDKIHFHSMDMDLVVISKERNSLKACCNAAIPYLLKKHMHQTL